MKNLQVILFLVLILWSWSCKTQPDQSNKEQKAETTTTVISEVMTPAKFQAKMEELGDEQLIDVRTPEEYQAGMIPDAENINVLADDFAEQAKKLNKNKPVMVYCRSGRRSARAASTLKDLGFTEIYDLDGGFISWTKNNLPTKTPSN
ncbi:MAG: rhodanese-like domain-containing protein [Bacteroidetes bacterium]|nr:rhodanese-like domain-containing protein [Bacteroidota bacterium]